jgi:hypothetical protein
MCGKYAIAMGASALDILAGLVVALGAGDAVGVTDQRTRHRAEAQPEFIADL